MGEMAGALQQLIKGMNGESKDIEAIGGGLKLAHGRLTGDHLHRTHYRANIVLYELTTISGFSCTTTKNQQD